MKQFCIVGLLLALSPFSIEGRSPIRVTLRKQTLESNLKSTSAILVSNSSWVFFGAMTLGTPQQSFNFAFDTASSLVWIPGTNCGNCGDMVQEFHSNASSTFSPPSTSSELTASFNTFGEVTYELCSDTLSVNGLNATNQTFGLASSMAHPLSGIDGFAGLGPGSNSFVRNILNQNNLSSVFSLYINPSSNGAEAGGIILGGTSSDNYYSNAQPYVTVPSVTQDSQWQIQIQTIYAGNNSFQCNMCNAQISILGNPYISGPSIAIQAIYQAIQANSTGFVSQSSDLPDVSFTIGGKNFNLTSDDYLLSCANETCSTKFIASATDSEFILGTVFVSKYFWIFNLTSSEISIAPFKGGSSTHQSGLFILVALVWAWLYLDKKCSS